MTSKLTKYGMMIIASVLLVAMVFAGAGAAMIGINSPTDLRDNIAGSTYDSSTNTVKLGSDATLSDSLVIYCTVTLDLNNKVLTAKKDSKLFDVVNGGSFTITDSSIAKNGKLKGNGYWNAGGGAIYVYQATFNMNGGSIENCNASDGGAVYLDNGIFNMNGGRIIDCTADDAGGAIGGCLGIFNMTGDASIVNCIAADAGAVFLEGGVFNMDDEASITHCTSAMNGGAAVVVDDCTFNMFGGSISDCNATGSGNKNGGGAVYVYSSMFNMAGNAKISNCNTTGSGEYDGGGAVYVNEGTFNMTDDATISHCNATKSGGAVFLGESLFNMTGGSITNCNAGMYGGGIIGIEARVILSDCSITNCNCDNIDGGGGVDIDGGSSSLNISGTVTITDNTNDDGANSNVYLYGYNYLVLDGDFDGSIGICYAGNFPEDGFQFGSTESSSHKGAGNFFADNDHTLVGSIVGTDLVWRSTYVEVSNWAQLNKSVAEWTDTETARTVVVNQDIIDRGYEEDYEGIEVSGNVIIMPNSSTTDEEVLIDGKNHGSLFTVVEGGNLTLCGNTTGGTAILNLSNGYFEAEGGGIYITGGSSLTLAKGAKITNCNAGGPGGAVYVNEGTFTMTGGSITGCEAYSGGAVFVYEGTFNMTGDASISDCTAIDGGAVYLNHGTFNLADEDASITYCTATSYGGGVFVYDVATFHMQDGCIRYCEAGECGGGIGTDFGAIVILSGGSITDCSCGDGYTGGGVDIANWCTFKISGPVIVTDNTEDGTENNNVYIYNYENLTLAGDFTGSVGITYSGGYPEEGLQFGITESSSFKGAKNFFADNANLVGSIDGNTLVWTVPTVHKKSSGQSGSTVILTETPTATPTAAATQAPADVPTAALIKPSAQQTQASPAPFVGLVLGLGIAGLVMRLRK